MIKAFSNQFFGRGYTPKQAWHFASLMEKQAAPVYQTMGIVFPVITSSTVSFITAVKSASLLEVARALEIPHQLASQRIKTLLKLEIITAYKDANDKRKTNYKLTEFGMTQSQLLDNYLAKADKVFTELNDELGVDLMKLLAQVNKSFADTSLLQRIVNEDS